MALGTVGRRPGVGGQATTVRVVVADLSIELEVPADAAVGLLEHYRGFSAPPPPGGGLAGRPTAVSSARGAPGAGPGAPEAEFRRVLLARARQLGWLPMHGAAIATRDGGVAILLGRSGTGKSTAARAFQSYCDELVLLRPDREGSEAASTPYWHGTPVHARCRCVVCLERGGVPAVTTLRGVGAVRAMVAHVVRPAGTDSAGDELAAVCDLARRTPVVSLRCPEGDAYLPFLDRGLARLGVLLRGAAPGNAG